MVADCPVNVVERLWLRTVPFMLWRDYGGGQSPYNVERFMVADCPINAVKRIWWRPVPLMW